MSVTYTERVGSGTAIGGATPQVTRVYLVSVTDGERAEDVRAALLGALPSLLGGVPLNSVRVEPNGEVDDTVSGEDAFVATAVWGATPASWSGEQQTGTVIRSFDTSGGTQRVFQALSTVGTYVPSGATAPDYGGAIGVSDDGVEGVDIVTATYGEILTRVVSAAAIAALRADAFALTGKVNSDAFLGFNPGEALFLGARGQQRPDGEYEVSFSFAMRPNRSTFMVGDIEVPAQKGWEYLWVRYQEVVDAAVKVRRPVAATVVKVYEEGAFAALGLGA